MGSHKPKSIAELISIIEVSLQKVKDSESTVTGEKALAWAKQIKSHKKIDLNTAPPPLRTLRLKHIRMHTVPNFDLTTGCDPFFDVRQGDGKLQVYNWLTAHGGRVANYKPRTTHVVDFAIWPKNDVRVTGDTKLVFYDKDDYSEPDKMFHLWFHTAFVERAYLRFPCVAPRSLPPPPPSPPSQCARPDPLPAPATRTFTPASPPAPQQANARQRGKGQDLRALCSGVSD